jgi:hypothetical protein
MRASDHRRVQIARQAGCPGFDGDETKRRDALLLAFELERLERLDNDGIACERERLGADQDLARVCSRLQAGGDVDGIARHERLAPRRHDLARVDPDPEIEGRAEVALELGVEQAAPVAQLGGGPHGPNGVVLVGPRARRRRP